MDELARTPVVPLEAGAGPDNPPCPACGEPLFGWLAEQERLGAPVQRCESCGLGVVGHSLGTEEALEALDRLGDQERARIVDRASFACSLGGAGWAGLEPGAHYLFTVEAVRRLVAERDQVVRRRRMAPGASFMVTWQTLLNSVTFGHNEALAALGSGRAAPAEKRWQRRIDALASVVLAIPAALIAVPIELAGAIFRRGAVVDVRFELL
jgi:pimeloyl-ACP methyl ester carboxylesterase